MLEKWKHLHNDLGPSMKSKSLSHRRRTIKEKKKKASFFVGSQNPNKHQIKQ